MLERAKEQLTQLGAENCLNCLQEHRAAAYIGAVAHDAPYYYRLGADPAFTHIAEALHSQFGQDTLKPLLAAGREIPKQPAQQHGRLWSFLLGMLSHYATDIVFHPMVYYFTGDYYSSDPGERKRARARHRLLEVYLDAWFAAQLDAWNGYRIGTALSEFGDAVNYAGAILEAACKNTFVSALTDSGTPIDPSAEKWVRGLSHMAQLQQLFYSTAAGFVMRKVNALSLGALDQYEALSAYGRRKPEPLFEERLSFRNPATDEQSAATVDELLELAAAECAKLFAHFDPLISGGKQEAQLDGRSLNTGILAAKAEPARFFSSEGLPLRGLKISAN